MADSKWRPRKISSSKLGDAKVGTDGPEHPQSPNKGGIVLDPKGNVVTVGGRGSRRN